MTVLWFSDFLYSKPCPGGISLSEVMDMRRRSVLRAIRMKLPDPASVGLLLLAACFLLGGFAASVYSETCDASSQAALGEYLGDYCALYEQNEANISFFKCVQLYFGSVFFAFFLGFSSLGVGLLPILSGFLGFTSFYTVSCFVLTFGRPGVFAAASLVAVRLLFTIPCFFLIASAAWRFSFHLAVLVLGHGKRAEKVHYSGRYFMLFVLCLIVLSIGICCEQFLTPYLFRSVAKRLDFTLWRGGVS